MAGDKETPTVAHDEETSIDHVMEQDARRASRRRRAAQRRAVQATRPPLRADAAVPPPPVFKWAIVRLRSEPPGARVVANGNVLSSVTPVAVATFAGPPPTVRMLRPGYLPAEKRIEITDAGNEVSIPLIKGTPKVGSLKVITAPEGTTISVNGNAVGVTPLVLPKVAALSEITLELTKEGCYPHVVTFTVDEGEEREVGIKLVTTTSSATSTSRRRATRCSCACRSPRSSSANWPSSARPS